MKRLMTVCLTALMLLTACACASAGTYTAGEYEVDRGKGTISDGTNIYRYTFTGNASSYQIEITYPDGSTYWWNQQEGSGYGGQSGGYEEGRYASGAALCGAIEAGAPKSLGVVVLAVVLAGIGLFGAILPNAAWYCSIGWKFKNAEPSGAALALTRAGGAAVIFAAVILLFMA